MERTSFNPNGVTNNGESCHVDSTGGGSSKRKRRTPERARSVPLAHCPSPSTQLVHDAFAAVQCQQEQEDQLNASCFVSVICQQLDATNRAAAKKATKEYTSRADPEAQTARQALDILAKTRKDIANMVKLLDLAEHDAVVQLQQRKEERFYYKKPKSDGTNESFDPELGCDESFPEEEQERKNEDSKSVQQSIILAVQETAIIRETARRIRQQARALAKRRIAESGAQTDEE